MQINRAELVTEQRNPNSLDIDLKSIEEIVESISRRESERIELPWRLFLGQLRKASN